MTQPESEEDRAADAFVALCDPKDVKSWAELELKAVISGTSTDRLFCFCALASPFVWQPMLQPVAEGVLSAPLWDMFSKDESLVGAICDISRFASGAYTQQWGSMSPALSVMHRMFFTAKGLAFGDMDAGAYLTHEKRKYVLLDAVERRFPLLPVKYYALNAARIHERDDRLGVWIYRRVRERAMSSEKFRRIYESMSAEYTKNHMTAVLKN